MSVKVMGRVWDSDLKPRMRLVLLAYADAAEHDGTRIFPGRERLVAMTGHSVSTLERITAELKSLGVLVQVRRGQIGQRAEFVIDLSHQCFAAPEPRVEGSVPVSESVPDWDTQPLVEGLTSATQECPISSIECVKTAEECVTVDPPSVLFSRPTTPVLLRSARETGTGGRRRDLLWDALVEVHGDPATKTERGKFNKARAMLAEAEVTPDEYAGLVSAYTSKYGGLQPAVMTVVSRVGEMRHYIRRGPVAEVDVDEVTARRNVARSALPGGVS